ncbi:uncharacterized protein LOC124160108 isoform X3 [Ischnura elegans]|uniref:uncharacterized protein LOC124160108 isoform X3 n=1 Tax=Ischnura elegans TaxID=197161 RepID=UPI001ED86A43|nr:uncharacterized protein LOC124160108 isoform X3 [Ischnura elegans]
MAFDVENSCPCFWDSLLCLSRVWGLLTAAVLSGVGVDLCYHGRTIGPFVLIGSLIVFVLEIAWAMLLLLHVFPRRAQRLPNGGEADEGDPAGVALRGGGLVSVVLKWCEGPSRKGVLYAVLGAVVLLWPHQHLWLSPVAGSMLLLLAALNLLLTLKTRGEEALGDSLLPPDDSGAFDRLDDVSDESSADATPPWKGASSLVGPAQQRLHGAECSGPGLKGPQLL